MTSSELRVLTEIVPDLSQVLGLREGDLGESSRRNVLQGADAEKGFVDTICKFFTAISSEGKPMILLVDDVHWSTPRSIALLRAIASRTKQDYGCRCLVICTCRLNFDAASCDNVCCSLKDGDYRTTEIRLQGLELTAVNELTSDVVGLDRTHSIDLARIVHSVTHGNPFHILQFLAELRALGLLMESGDDLRSHEKEILMLGARRSVMILVRNRIERLPTNVKDMLKVASCIGTTFSQEFLKAGILMTSSDATSAVRHAAQEGIFQVESDPNTIRFAHDQFRQAAYAMIREKERKAFHLDVGRRLWHRLSIDQRDNHLRTIADQISSALSLITDEDESSEFGRLFLRAGHQAAQTASFSAAAGYLQCGIRILSSNHWTTQYKLSLALHNTAAEIEFFCGKFARVNVLVDQILSSARSFEDTLVARFTMIYCLGARSEMAKALDESFIVMSRLGERFPRQVCTARLVWELRKCNTMLRGKSQKDILELPNLTDSKRLTAIRMLNIAFSFALLSSDKCGPVIASRAAMLTLRYGLSELCKSTQNQNK